MSKSTTTSRVRATYEFIKAQRTTYSVEMLCHVLGVAPSGYYAWLNRPLRIGRRRIAPRPVNPRVVRASQGIYGAPRVFLDLREAGDTLAKTASLGSCEQRLRALHGERNDGRRTASRWFDEPVAPSLQRNPTQSRLGQGHQVHVDMAGLAVSGGGDGSSSRDGLVGWVRDPLSTELGDAALMAVAREAAGRADSFRSRHPIRAELAPLLVGHIASAQMSRKGNCWDNAVAEAFFGSLKKELVKKQIYNRATSPRPPSPTTSRRSTIAHVGTAI